MSHLQLNSYANNLNQEFLMNSSVNIEKFNSCLDDKLIMNDLIIAKDVLLSQGVSASHVCRVNGFLYDHEDTKDILEALISQQFLTNIN